MIFAGVYSINGIEYYFNRVETPQRIGWYVYNKTLVANGNVYQLNPESLRTFKAKDLKPFLIAAHEATLDCTRMYGNVYLIESLLTSYNKVKGIRFPETKEEEEQTNDGLLNITTAEHGGYYLKETRLLKNFIKGESVTGFFIDGKGNKKKKEYTSTLYGLNFVYKGVKVVTYYQHTGGTKKSTFNLQWMDSSDAKTFQSRHKRDLVLSSRQKTIQQLRLEHDLSWYFDAKGHSKKSYNIINTLEELRKYAKEVFPKLKYWAFDVEATGLNLFEGENPDNFDHVVSIMMSWEENQAIFIPIDMEYMQNIPEGWVEILKPFLESIGAIGHNIGFDARAMLVDFGIKLKIVHDTQQLNFNLNTHRAKFHNSLKYLEHKYLNVDTLELKDIFGSKKLGGLFKYIQDPELALMYACPDVEYCLRLFKLLYKMLPVSCRKGYKLDMDTMVHVYQMDAVGNKINVPLAQSLREANMEDMKLLEQMIYTLVGQSILMKDKIEELKLAFINDEITEDQIPKILEEFVTSNDYKNAKYQFKISSNKELIKIMFYTLDYPVQGRSKNSKEPVVDAKALGGLMKYKGEHNYLLKDIPSAESKVFGKKVTLLEAKEYNKLDYPLAKLITEYRLRSKRDGTFYKQLLDTSIEGRYYSQSKMASAETFRIINVIQTLQGYMKKMIIPYSEDYYLLVFDFSQIEYRFMAGLGKQSDLAEKLNSFRADFHKECCALLHKIEPWQVTSKMRKEGKSLNFAIPYGMGEWSIAEQLFKAVNTETLTSAREQLHNWKKIFKKIWDYLEERRADALRDGYVANPLGRRRWFYDGAEPGEDEEEKLSEWKRKRTKAATKTIYRAAGNYPIQSGAADLFKIALRDFRRRLEKEGIAHLVKTSATVHDEIVSSVHKSVNPYFLYKIIWEECMKHIKDHPRYFAGVSICDNWYEGKDDLYEAPIDFVYHIVNSPISNEKFVYQEDAKNHVLNDIKEYMGGLFKKEFAELGLDLSKRTLDYRSLIPSIKDYFLRDKIGVYNPIPKNKGKASKEYEDDYFIRCLEEFCLKNGERDEYLVLYPLDYPQGSQAILTNTSRTFTDAMGNILKVESYIEDTSVLQSQPDTGADLDLSLDLDSSNANDNSYSLDLQAISQETDSDDMSINMLHLFEMMDDEDSEGGFFADDVYYVSAGTNTVKDEQVEVDTNLEKYSKHYSEFRSAINLTPHSLILDITNLSDKQVQDFIDTLNQYAVSSDTLGATQFVRKVFNQLDYTDYYFKGFSVEALREAIGEDTVEDLQPEKPTV